MRGTKPGKITFGKGSTYGKNSYGKGALEGSNDVDAGPFRRLPEHTYPLSDLSGTTNDISSQGEGPDEAPYSRDGSEILPDMPWPSPPKNAMTVKREWEVEHV